MTDAELTERVQWCCAIIRAIPSHQEKFEVLRSVLLNTVGLIDYQPPSLRDDWFAELWAKVQTDLQMLDVTFGEPAGNA